MQKIGFLKRFVCHLFELKRGMREITFIIGKKTVTRNFQYKENREFKRFGVQIELFGNFIFSYRAS